MNTFVRGPAPSRYMQILADLRSRIEKGHYALGTSLPTEGELCEEFEASRYTVREALRRLVDQGMVHRRQGSGSVVVATQPLKRYVHSLSSLQGLFQFALDTHYEIVSVEPVILDPLIAEDVGGEPGTEWILVKGVRRTRKGGEVVGFVHSYVPKRLGRYVKELYTCVGAFYAHLSKRAKEDIVEADQIIRGGHMDREMAKVLGGRKGDVVICSIRRYWGKKGPLISSFNWHAADDFKFYMKLQRND